MWSPPPPKKKNLFTSDLLIYSTQHTKKQDPQSTVKKTTSYRYLKNKSSTSIQPELACGVGRCEGRLAMEDNRRRSPVFSQGSVGQQMAGEHRNSGKSGGTITALPLCLQSVSFFTQGPNTWTDDDDEASLAFTFPSFIFICIMMM